VAYGGPGSTSYVRQSYSSEQPIVAPANEFEYARQVSDFETANTPRTVRLDDDPLSEHNLSEHDVESRRDKSQSGEVTPPGELWENEGGKINGAAPPVLADANEDDKTAVEP
jgi:hypothetical protein